MCDALAGSDTAAGDAVDAVVVVDLVTAGREVRGVDGDVTPVLVAGALTDPDRVTGTLGVTGRLPVGAEGDGPDRGADGGPEPDRGADGCRDADGPDRGPSDGAGGRGWVRVGSMWNGVRVLTTLDTSRCA